MTDCKRSQLELWDTMMWRKRSSQHRNTSVCLNSREHKKGICSKEVSLSWGFTAWARGPSGGCHSCSDHTACPLEPGWEELLVISVGAARPSQTLPQDHPPLHILVLSMCGWQMLRVFWGWFSGSFYMQMDQSHWYCM